MTGFITAFTLISLLGFWEWTQFSGIPSLAYPMRVAVLLLSVLFIAVTFWIIPYDIPSLTQVLDSHLKLLTLGNIWWLVAIALVINYPEKLAFWQKSFILKFAFGVLTLIPFLWSVILLRSVNYSVDPYYGAKLVLLVCLLVWSADSGAYFIGKYFGRYKMSPLVSPNKTIEGLFGGVLVSFIVGWAYTYSFDIKCGSPVLMLFISGATVMMSVLGDLVESMFKRVADIKDSSNLIPGHGGVLDRIDSLTAAFPIFAFLYFNFH